MQPHPLAFYQWRIWWTWDCVDSMNLPTMRREKGSRTVAPWGSLPISSRHLTGSLGRLCAGIQNPCRLQPPSSTCLLALLQAGCRATRPWGQPLHLAPTCWVGAVTASDWSRLAVLYFAMLLMPVQVWVRVSFLWEDSLPGLFIFPPSNMLFMSKNADRQTDN